MSEFLSKENVPQKTSNPTLLSFGNNLSPNEHHPLNGLSRLQRANSRIRSLGVILARVSRRLMPAILDTEESSSNT